MSEILSTDAESLRVELEEIGRSLRLSFHRATTSSSRRLSNSSVKVVDEGHQVDSDADYAVQWAEIERLPTTKRLRTALLGVNEEEVENNGKQMMDVTKLGSPQRSLLIGRLIKDIQNDHLRLLRKIRDRVDKVGVQLPTIEVRYKNLCVEAECEVVHGKPVSTLWNSVTSTFFDVTKFLGTSPRKAKITILDDVGGIIKPGRLTLLLGPPGCGKTSFLKALSGNLNQSVKITGEVSYNGYKLEEFVPQRTSAYISQNEVHFPEMTVREIIDFSARCQGVGFRSEMMMEVGKREKEGGIIPDPDIDAYLKAISVKGLERTLQTDYVLKILGLESCAHIQAGDALRRGISGGQKRSLTTGEMAVGPTRALFMDEITNGLDSSAAFQVVACLQQLVHITDATILVSLLQPAPETFDLFDDLILMSEGKTVYHGPRDQVLDFFDDCGFRCPKRKGIADFVQEVLSRQDQAQYWYHAEVPYSFVTADMFQRRFKESPLGNRLDEEISVPYDKSKSHKNAISFKVYFVSKWQLFKACMEREIILLKRNSSVYVFKTIQLIILAVITMTVFLKTRKDVTAYTATYHMGSLFFSLLILIMDTFPEASMTVARLAVFHKQKALSFYPAWAYAVPHCIVKIPLSFCQAAIWTSITYYVIGYSPEVQRFFRQILLNFGVHLSASSVFRFVGSAAQTSVLAMTAAISIFFVMVLFGGFVITHPSMPGWLQWAFWISPMTYAEIGLSSNEFLAPRWNKLMSGNTTIGQQTLESRGLNFDGYMYWVSVAALIGFTILFNIAYAVGLTFVKASGSSGILISHKELSKVPHSQDRISATDKEEKSKNSNKTNVETQKGRMVLPFTSLALAFEDVQYFVDTPLEMRERGFSLKKLQLLSDISGTLRPGVLTALMGVSGAGKTTLLDVISGRKTSGYVKGQVKVGGYPKVQETFARISGYCEQSDIHSPQITVEESLMFSAWLRLSSEIDSKTKAAFVKDVLESIELDEIKDALVGIPGVSGLSNEQRKRLTIAVELVANPSIIFMDEPTTGLDQRAAAIVMRAVKNIADTGRTILCTIHQPSIDIFESFDELILLKRGGQIIYYGPLGQNSSSIIEYFEAIPGVPKIRNNYNPATWMFEVTSPSIEAELGIDFAQIYKESGLWVKAKELVEEWSIPPPGSSNLQFSTQFSLNSWGQFKCCLWKQHLSYWRSPSYNLIRIIYTLVISLTIGIVFWNHATKIENQQDVIVVFGSMYAIIFYVGIYNSTTTLPYIAAERTVMSRERFAGMYSLWSYPLAQVMIEVPYLLIQAFISSLITYTMIGYDGSAKKISYYCYAIFCSFFLFKCLGMLLVSITPNLTVAAILSSACFPMFNLFSGYLIPRPNVPDWWIWMYYGAPTSWMLNGFLNSQYGDVQKNIVAFGETKTVAAFLKDYFGYHHDFLPVVAVVLILYPLILASFFGFFIGRLNFQKR